MRCAACLLLQPPRRLLPATAPTTYLVSERLLALLAALPQAQPLARDVAQVVVTGACEGEAEGVAATDFSSLLGVCVRVAVALGLSGRHTYCHNSWLMTRTLLRGEAAEAAIGQQQRVRRGARQRHARGGRQGAQQHLPAGHSHMHTRAHVVTWRTWRSCETWVCGYCCEYCRQRPTRDLTGPARRHIDAAREEQRTMCVKEHKEDVAQRQCTMC